MDISINKNRDTIVTTSVGTSSNPRYRVLHLGLHHFNPPSLNGNLGRASLCAPKGHRDADSRITSEATMDYSFLALKFLFLQCIQEAQYIALQIGNGGSSPSVIKEYGRPRVNIFENLC